MGKEAAQQGLEHKVRLGVGPAVGQHGLHQLQKLSAVLTAEGQAAVPQAQAPQAASALRPVEADPEIGPGLLPAGLVEGLPVGLNEEALSLVEQELLILHAVGAAAVQDIVEEVVGPDCRAAAVQGLAAGVAAVAEIEVGELLILLLQVQNAAFFHCASSLVRQAGIPRAGNPGGLFLTRRRPGFVLLLRYSIKGEKVKPPQNLQCWLPFQKTRRRPKRQSGPDPAHTLPLQSNGGYVTMDATRPE